MTKNKDIALKAFNDGSEVHYRQPSTTEFLLVESDVVFICDNLEYVIGPLEIDLGIK